MTEAPNPPAQTPEEVARAITDGFARALRDTPGAAGSLELNIEYALRAAAQAERVRIAALVRQKAQQHRASTPSLPTAFVLDALADHLSPAPEGAKP